MDPGFVLMDIPIRTRGKIPSEMLFFPHAHGAAVSLNADLHCRVYFLNTFRILASTGWWK
jgi:hypothetical protein